MGARGEASHPVTPRLGAIDRTNERRSERASERTSERRSDGASERASERARRDEEDRPIVAPATMRGVCAATLPTNPTVARCGGRGRNAAVIVGGRRVTPASVARARASATEGTAAVSANEATWEDGFVGRCVTTTGSSSSSSGAEIMDDARKSAELVALKRARAPTTRAEAYRFTDFGGLTSATLARAKEEGAARGVAEKVRLDGCAARVVIADGGVEVTDDQGAKSAGVVVAKCSEIGTCEETGAQSAGARGNVFSGLNAACASDVVIVRVPAGVKLVEPIHIVHASSGGKDGAVAVSAPRVTVVLERGAEASIVEDFLGEAEAEYWQNGVCEITIGQEASLTHAMIQNHGRAATHTRTTLVTQEEGSKYEVDEVSVGGKMARHDLNVKQLGPRTETVLACFNLAGANQTLDLHSTLQLDHEEGKSDQIHKCIVSAASGRGVFDGNVQVNRLAQRTDAQQLSRNLLLVPKATVNVKPNLQIIADDVKCTHGCTVSDLEEEELFYIRSRGLSTELARSLLVSGFGVEVISRLPGKDLRDRVNSIVRASLERDRVQFEWTGDN